MRVSILLIGSELTKGIVRDVNGAWLAETITSMGHEVERILVVPDREEAIIDALNYALQNSDVVITTGGLGFTEDDITLECVCKALGLGQKLCPEVAEEVRDRYVRLGLRVPKNYTKAAMLPEGSRVIRPAGTVPGVHITLGGKEIFVLPGYPAEVRHMFETYIRSRLEERGVAAIVEAEVEGMTEEEVEEAVRGLARDYPGAYVKTHAGRPVRVTILVRAGSREELERLARGVADSVRTRLSTASLTIREVGSGSCKPK